MHILIANISRWIVLNLVEFSTLEYPLIEDKTFIKIMAQSFLLI